MSRKRLLTGATLALTGFALVAWTAPDRSLRSTLSYGTPEFVSVGALAFGPENILFIGDTRGAAVFAVDVADEGRPARGPVNLEGVDRHIAHMLGTSPDQITIHDLAVHPESKNAYLSVSRGEGEAASPVLVRVTGGAEVQLVDMEDVRFSKAEITNAPDADAELWRRPARTFTVTDLSYIDGQVYVAGLSNEEFASNLRRLPFPFNGEMEATSLEIYHVSHGQDETNAPVETFAAVTVGGKPSLLAAYTCTPLVQFDVANLKDGAHVVGKTVAELGAGNRPLDIVEVEWEGRKSILIANSRHPLMKMDVGDVQSAKQLVNPSRERGARFENLSAPGIKQLADLNDEYILAIQQNGESIDLVSLAKASL